MTRTVYLIYINWPEKIAGQQNVLRWCEWSLCIDCVAHSYQPISTTSPNTLILNGENMWIGFFSLDWFPVLFKSYLEKKYRSGNQSIMSFDWFQVSSQTITTVLPVCHVLGTYIDWFPSNVFFLIYFRIIIIKTVACTNLVWLNLEITDRTIFSGT